MTVIATCGHDVTAEWRADPEQLNISIMEYSRTGENAVAYYVACADCRKRYEEWGIVLHTEEEENKWLSGELEYPA